MDEIDSLHEGEHLELEARRFRGPVYLMLGMWSVAVLFISVIFSFAIRYATTSTVPVGYLYLAWAATIALVAIIAYASVIIYNRNRLIITNKRIVIVTQVGLSGHKVMQCHLEFIQDVSTERPSFWAGVFDYGKVCIETSGKEQQFNFPLCLHPHAVASKIVRLCKQTELAPVVPRHNFIEGEAELRFDNTNGTEDHEEGVLLPAAKTPAETGPHPEVAGLTQDLPDLSFEIPSARSARMRGSKAQPTPSGKQLT